MLIPGQHIHLVGIGGAGLSAIARILLGQGYHVSGSDRSPNALTEALARDGAVIHAGHDAQAIQGANALIITSAVGADQVEVAAARAAGLPVYRRQDIMADLMRGQHVVAVAGTKGKTTTTAMIVHLLRACGKDPSYIVGGVMANTGTNAAVGADPIFVVEADEYDHMFHGLRPHTIVLTNLEWDHPDCFPSFDDLIASFRRFIDLMPAPHDRGGLLIACADDAVVRQLADEQRAKPWTGTYTYGLSAEADMRATHIHTDADDFTAFAIHFGGSAHIPARIRLPGSHNVRNALAALLTALPMTGAPMFTCGLPALERFEGSSRRFELRAEVHGVAVVDDYAHNPMSIRAALEAARQRYPQRAIWAVWQPHTYSRTQALFDAFAQAFAAADHVLVTDIYAAREQPLPGVTGQAMAAAIHHPDARWTPTFAEAAALLGREVRAPAVILIMSAGDAPQIGSAYLEQLQQAGQP